MIKEILDKLHFHAAKAAKMPVSEHRIGMSFAVGTFLALMPLSIFAVGISLTLALFFRQLHKISLALALVFWNPFVNAIFIYPAVIIGGAIISTPITFTWPYIGEILTKFQFYIVGICLIAILMASLSYFVVRLIVRIYRARAKNKPINYFQW